MRETPLLSRTSILSLLALWVGCFAFPAIAQEEKPGGDKKEPIVETPPTPAEKKAEGDAEKENEKAPPGLRYYMFRQVARTMHFREATWLMRETRESEEHCSLVLSNIGLKPGMTVCDMGCGSGYYTLDMAKLVGEEGKILAVDIQPQMLRMLRTRIKKAKIENIEPILGTYTDPKLAPDSCDLIFCVDVYHEFSHPEHMLAQMRKALKKDGLLLLVEFRAEDPKVPIYPEHKMSREQVMKEMAANGFKFSKEFTKLPWQHMMFFARDEAFEDARKPGELDLPDEAKGTIR